MNKNDKRVKVSMRNFILALILLLLTNTLMGVTLMTISKKTLREQIKARMLDVSNTAAYQLDGDELENLTADDKGTEDYEEAMGILRAFQMNIELKYIYAVKDDGDGSFSFTIDPDPDDPSPFGADIEATEALKNAAKGTADIDKKAHTDQWGRFYTAYSPVFDSNGNVAGIVGVDFDADWYDDTINSHRAVAVILTMVALTIGIVLSFVIMSQNRRHLEHMLESISELDHETQRLDNIIMKTSIKRLNMLPESKSAVLKTLASGEEETPAANNEYEELEDSIRSVYEKLQKYISYIERTLYIDNVTGVLNKVAYKEKIGELDTKVSEGSSGVFSIGFFDINGIKKIYTHYGFEAGEKLMFECATILKKVFGRHRIYHVTGDEFIAIMEDSTMIDMKDLFYVLEEEIKEYNREHIKDNRLSVARGFATYDPEKFKGYREVFVAAKKACDDNKADHYGKTADQVTDIN